MTAKRKKNKDLEKYDEDGMTILGTAEPKNIIRLHAQLKKLSKKIEAANVVFCQLELEGYKDSDASLKKLSRY